MTRSPLLAALLATTALTAFAGTGPARAQVAADTLPTGGQVVSGAVSVATARPGRMEIRQSSGSAVVNWQGFSIGRDARVDIQQPGAGSAILNRVTGTAPSTIAGQLNANGQVYLVNPSGIAITKTGSVKAAGFVASTLDIGNDEFEKGQRSFRGNGASAAVSNEGSIAIARGGYAALIGGKASNSGTISVPLGKVALGSGERATLDLSGDGFLQVAVPTADGGEGALVTNSGTIRAAGGRVELSAATAREAARRAVNLSGVVEATGVSGRNGAIVLSGGDGGTVKVGGRLDAGNAEGSGGSVTVTGKAIALKGAAIEASGKTGGGTVRIGGGRQGKGTLQRAERVKADKATTITADATVKGKGGEVTVWSDAATDFAGTVRARGGAQGGDGGQAEVSSKGRLAYTGWTDLRAEHGTVGTLLLDPYNVTISTGADSGHSGFTAGADDSVINAATLTSALTGANVTVSTGGGGTQAGDITVAAPLSWGAATTLTLDAYHSIAVNADISITGGGGLTLTTNNGGSGGTLTFGNGASASFAAGQSGQALTVNGNAYTLLRSMADIDGIDTAGLGGRYALATSLDASGTTYTDALVGVDFVNPFTGVFEGLGHAITGLTITKSGNFAGLFGYVGNAGEVRDIGLVGGAVSGAESVGGLVGYNNLGAIANAYATGTVSGIQSVGGLVGFNGATITNAYATGAVSGSSLFIGGLVGSNSGGTIGNAYATGAVSGGGLSSGGLVGYNLGMIDNVYATGTSHGGGLVGQHSAGALTNAHWDTQTSGRSSAFGASAGTVTNVTGLTTAQLQDGASASGLGGGFTRTNGLYPYLTSFFPGGVQAISGTAYKDAGVTAAASGASGAVTVTGFANGTAFGTATTGANGYYYIARAAGAFNAGDSLLTHTTADATTGSTDAATLATATGTGPQSGIDVYGKTLTLSTAATTLSAAPTLAAARSSAITAAGSDATATAVINATAGRGFRATGAGFTIDQTVDTAGGFLVRTATGAPLTVSSPITIQPGGSLGLLSGGALAIDAPVAVRGAGAVVLAHDTASVTNLGFGNGASLTYTDAAGSAITASAGGTLAVNGNAYALLYSMADIDGIDSAGLSGRYALARSLDASGTTYAAAPVAGVFDGVFEGLGHSIAGLTVSAPASCAGLFCNVGTSGVLRDIGLVGGTVTGGTNVGGLAGSSDGMIAYATATTTASGSQAVGSLVGYHYANGTITNAHASGAVSGTTAIGGLVGANYGTISKATASGAVTGTTNVGGLAGANTGTITTATATGTATGNQAVGGLVGLDNGGTVSNAHASGAVTGSTRVGGLVGDNRAGSTLTATYATGAVTGTTNVGGFVGNNAGTIVNGLWNTETSGRSAAFGSNGSGQSATGLTTAQFQDGTMAAGLGGGFTLSSGLYPYLTSLFPDGVQAVSGTAPTGGTVNLRADTGTVATVFVGADGSYYVALPAGSIAGSGSSLLAWSTGAATNGASFRTGVTAGRVTGFDVTGNRFDETTGLTTLSALDAAYATSSTGSGIAGTYADRAITATGAFTIDGALAATGTLTIGSSGDLTIGAAGIVSGASPRLSATGAFVNSRGSDAVTATSGRWLIYSASSAGDSFGGLDSGNSAVWNTAAGAAVGAGGNRYVFAEQPALTVTTLDAGKTYGDAETAGPASFYTVTGLSSGVAGAYLADSAASVMSGIPSLTSTGFAAPADAGSYGYSLGLGTLTATGGYTVGLSNTGRYTVAPRAVTVTADTQSRVYGDANPALTYTASGLVNGDTLTGSLATAATTGSGVGTYAITGNSLSAGGNYTLSVTDGSLTVTPRPLSVTADAQSRVYGDANPALTYRASGLVNGDRLMGDLAVAATATSGVGTYAITRGTLSAGGNYTLGVTGSDLTVTPRAITVIADSQRRGEGEAIPTLTYVLGSGSMVNGDALSGALGTSAASDSAAGTYAITRGTLTAGNNYTLSFVDGILTVLPRPAVPPSIPELVPPPATTRSIVDASMLASTVSRTGSASDDPGGAVPPPEARVIERIGQGSDERTILVDPRFAGSTACIGSGHSVRRCLTAPGS
ncbi:MBG domain-containing protein [Azospirillum endophyticum]